MSVVVFTLPLEDSDLPWDFVFSHRHTCSQIYKSKIKHVTKSSQLAVDKILEKGVSKMNTIVKQKD